MAGKEAHGPVFKAETHEPTANQAGNSYMNSIHGLYVNLEKHSFHHFRAMARSPLKQ